MCVVTFSHLAQWNGQQSEWRERNEKIKRMAKSFSSILECLCFVLRMISLCLNLNLYLCLARFHVWAEWKFKDDRIVSRRLWPTNRDGGMKCQEDANHRESRLKNFDGKSKTLFFRSRFGQHHQLFRSENNDRLRRILEFFSADSFFLDNLSSAHNLSILLCCARWKSIEWHLLRLDHVSLIHFFPLLSSCDSHDFAVERVLLSARKNIYHRNDETLFNECKIENIFTFWIVFFPLPSLASCFINIRHALISDICVWCFSFARMWKFRDWRGKISLTFTAIFPSLANLIHRCRVEFVSSH